MRKQLIDKTIYKPNEDVKITVNNKPIIDDDSGEVYMYEVSVTLAIKKYESNKALRFKSDKELIEYVQNINLTDVNANQTSLLPEEE